MSKINYSIEGLKQATCTKSLDVKVFRRKNAEGKLVSMICKNSKGESILDKNGKPVEKLAIIDGAHNLIGFVSGSLCKEAQENGYEALKSADAYFEPREVVNEGGEVRTFYLLKRNFEDTNIVASL